MDKKPPNKKVFNPPKVFNNPKHNDIENESSTPESLLGTQKSVKSQPSVKNSQTTKSNTGNTYITKSDTQKSTESRIASSTTEVSKINKTSTDSKLKGQENVKSSLKDSKTNKPAVSLTNSQYEDIFDSVLSKITNENSQTIDTEIYLSTEKPTNISINKENDSFENSKTDENKSNNRKALQTIFSQTSLTDEKKTNDSNKKIKPLRKFELNNEKIRVKKPKMSEKPRNESSKNPDKQQKRTKSLETSKVDQNKKMKIDKPHLQSSQKSTQKISNSKFPLSQPPKSFTHRQRLEWLQERRGNGTWVQCSRPTCKKWRYLDYIKEPIDVPTEWFCSMNQDKQFASCSAPEKGPSMVEEDDCIYNIYTAGSIVWAQLEGFPWWPAMVDDCPDTEQYYWLNGYSDIPTHYNVVFFDSKEVSRAWISPTYLKPFKTGTEFPETKVRRGSYRERISAAKKMALEALGFDIKTRLKKFSFIARWNGPINDPIDINSDSDENLDNTELDVLCSMSLSLDREVTDGTAKAKRQKKASRVKGEIEPLKEKVQKIKKIKKIKKDVQPKDKASEKEAVLDANTDKDDQTVEENPDANKSEKNIRIEETQLSAKEITQNNLTNTVTVNETEISDTNLDHVESLSEHSSAMFDSDEDLTDYLTGKEPQSENKERDSSQKISSEISKDVSQKMSLNNSKKANNKDLDATQVEKEFEEFIESSQKSLPFEP